MTRSYLVDRLPDRSLIEKIKDLTGGSVWEKSPVLCRIFPNLYWGTEPTMVLEQVFIVLADTGSQWETKLIGLLKSEEGRYYVRLLNVSTLYRELERARSEAQLEADFFAQFIEDLDRFTAL